MIREELNEEYFIWLCHIVSGYRYLKLMHLLYDTEFTYTIGLDGNRAEDGADLRYRFGRECKYNDALIASYLDVKECSVLEMMVALAVRCEEHIMEDSDIGDRTSFWFWEMVRSLGLQSMDDRHFNMRYTKVVISAFLNRKFERNGRGGLFTVKNSGRDMRTTEIWYQMCLYLDDIIERGN